MTLLTPTEIARKLGIARATVSDVAERERWKAQWKGKRVKYDVTEAQLAAVKLGKQKRKVFDDTMVRKVFGI